MGTRMKTVMTTPARLPISSHTPAPYDGPSRDEVLAMRRQYLTPGLITYYREPLLIAEGHMQYVWDETGKQYLDAFAGIVTVSVGHCHPKIVEKVREQVGRLQHTTTIYLHPAIAQLGKKLAEHMPAGSGLSVSYFTNSGSEANEIAILSSREFTGNTDVISLRNGYHGGTQAAMALTAHGTWKFKIEPDGGREACDARLLLSLSVRTGVSELRRQVCAGCRRPDQVRDARRGRLFHRRADPGGRRGGHAAAASTSRSSTRSSASTAACASPTRSRPGFGRTGTAFWGFENWGVTPDLVTMAKGIGNGVPLGACVTRPEIARVMKNRVHFNTFGGNPISMTQGLATLEVIDSEGIQQNALVVGDAPEGSAPGAAGAPAADRRGPRHGADAGRRAGARPPVEGTRHSRDGRPAGAVQGARAC